jgi:hypothetical protein
MTSMCFCKQYPPVVLNRPRSPVCAIVSKTNELNLSAEEPVNISDRETANAQKACSAQWLLLAGQHALGACPPRGGGAKPVRWSLETDDPKIERERYKAGKAKYIATVNFGDANHTFEEAYAAWDQDMQSAIGDSVAEDGQALYRVD